MRKETVALVAVVAVLVVSAVAGPTLASMTSPGDDVNKTTSEARYALDDLQDAGTRVPEIHDGWRPISGDTAAAWVEYYPTGAFVDDSEGSEQWRYLSPSTTVRRNYVDLTVMRLGDVETEQIEVKVVYWQKGTRTVERGNETTTEEYAANQTVETVSTTVSGRGSEIRVPLRAHYDEPVQVTMWLANSEETARWTYTHHSLKSAQDSPADSAGETALSIGKVTAIGGVLALFCYGVGRLFNRRALVGPMKGLVWWGAVIGGLQGLFTVAAWDWVANLISTTPEVFAIELAFLGLILGIESKGRNVCYSAMFLRAEVDVVGETALGEPGVEANGLGHDTKLVVQDESGSFVVVRSGIRGWLIRVLAGRYGRTHLRGTDTMKSMIQVTEGAHDLAFYVKPTANTVLDYVKPRMRPRIPDISLKVAGLGIGGVVLLGVISYAAGFGHGPGLGLGAFFCLPAFIRVDAPDAYIEGAPAHFADSHANQMVLAAHYDAVRTVDDARQELAEQEARHTVTAEQRDEERSATLVEETLGMDVAETSLDDLVDVDDDLLDKLKESRRSDAGDDSKEVSLGD